MYLGVWIKRSLYAGRNGGSVKQCSQSEIRFHAPVAITGRIYRSRLQVLITGPIPGPVTSPVTGSVPVPGDVPCSHSCFLFRYLVPIPGPDSRSRFSSDSRTWLPVQNTGPDYQSRLPVQIFNLDSQFRFRAPVPSPDCDSQPRRLSSPWHGVERKQLVPDTRDPIRIPPPPYFILSPSQKRLPKCTNNYTLS